MSTVAFPKPEPWLTKAELACELKASERWIEKMAHKGLPSHRWSRQMKRYKLSEVENWLSQREEKG